MSVARDFDDDLRDYGPESVRAALDHAAWSGQDFAPIGDDAERMRFSALPFTWRDPATIPRREFLYGFELRRKQVSATIAPGAAGKTTFKIGRAICMAANKELLGHRVWNGPHRVWLWNLEDDMEEVEKTVHAFMKLWELTEMDLGGRLFINGVDSVGSAGLKLATEADYGGFRLQQPVAAAVTDALKEQQIDYLDIDPFVSSHAVDENSNQGIDAVAKEWLRIAHEANCAVGLAHHLRKATGAEFTANDARGAGAMINAARSCLVLQQMSREAAEEFRIDPGERKRFFSIYDDKNNKAPPAAKAEWYEFVGIGLGNENVGSHGPEDSIGTVRRWAPPDAFGGMTSRQLYNVQKEIDENPNNTRKSAGSPQWVGKLVARVLELNADNEGDAGRIKTMLRTWLSSGALKTVERDGADRRPREFVEVGKWAEIE